MNKVNYSEKPLNHEAIGLGRERYRWDINQVTVKNTDPQSHEETEHTEWQCYEVEIAEGTQPLYPALVSAIISAEYTIDAQIAILANRGDENPEHDAEYEAFEQWRTHAKKVAHQFVGE